MAARLSAHRARVGAIGGAARDAPDWIRTSDLQALPIPCSLGADDLAARLELIAAIGAESLISRDNEGDTQLLRFRDDDGVRRSLEGVVAAEARCCSFLGMEIREEAGALVLVIDAPTEAAPVAAELAAAFAAE